MVTKLERDELKGLLRERGLRITASRVSVLGALAEAAHPVSHSELVQSQGEEVCDASTTFRTLKTLVEEGLAVVVSRVDGIDRYAFKGTDDAHGHEHAHFVCDSCEEVLCLPDSVAPIVSPGDRWAASVKTAQIELRGECPDCIEAD